jgi:hypothetical protein
LGALLGLRQGFFAAATLGRSSSSSDSDVATVLLALLDVSAFGFPKKASKSQIPCFPFDFLSVFDFDDTFPLENTPIDLMGSILVRAIVSNFSVLVVPVYTDRQSRLPDVCSGKSVHQRQTRRYFLPLARFLARAFLLRTTV